MSASSFCPDLNGPLCMPRWLLLPTHADGVRRGGRETEERKGRQGEQEGLGGQGKSEKKDG